MYTLYIDESGDPGRYLDLHGTIIPRSSRFFSMGGLIIEDGCKKNFHNEVDRVINKYFGTTVSSDFKLHYTELKLGKNSFRKLYPVDRVKLADEVFEIIQNFDCKLISATIDLANHYYQYKTPINPRYYALLLILERYQYFLEDSGSNGNVYYERVEGKLHKRMQRAHRNLSRWYNIPNPTNLANVNPRINFAHATLEKILQISDFFVHATWIRSEKNDNVRWESIKENYYNLDYWHTFRRGNCEV